MSADAGDLDLDFSGMAGRPSPNEELISATARGRARSVALALERGADPNARDPLTGTIVMETAWKAFRASGGAAERLRRAEILEALAFAGGDPMARSLGRRKGPLELAIIAGDEAGALLLSCGDGLDPNARDAWDRPIFCGASQNGMGSLCAALLEKGADPWAVDPQAGMTGVELGKTSRDGYTASLCEAIEYEREIANRAGKSDEPERRTRRV